MKTKDLKSGFHMFGNKGACWSNEVHIADGGSSTTMCGTPMLSTNWANIWNKDEIGCPDCLKAYDKAINYRATTEHEQDVFAYLNGLREEGTINMFGAAPHVADEFQLSKGESRDLVALWMLNFNDECNYEEIKITPNV